VATPSASEWKTRRRRRRALEHHQARRRLRRVFHSLAEGVATNHRGFFRAYFFIFFTLSHSSIIKTNA